jgi:hypothetical protein
MRKVSVAALLLLAGWLANAPLAAEVFTVTLNNGATFDSRHEPRAAAWDANMLEFITDTGLPVALPRALVREVTAQSEVKGFGRVLNTTTIDLGFAPNDVVNAEQNAGQTAQQLSPMESAFASGAFNQRQFAEPSEAGIDRPSGGIPVTGLGGYGGGGGGGGIGGAPVGGSAPPVRTPAPAPVPEGNPSTPPAGSGGAQ